MNGHVGDTKGGKNVFIEVTLANEQFVDAFQKLARACPLNDAVVIGGGEGDGFSNTQIRQGALGSTLEFCRIFQRSSTNNAGLPPHQPRHGVNSSNTAGVRQRHRVALEVSGFKFAFTGSLNNVFVGGNKVSKPHPLAALNAWNNEGSGAIWFGEVDGNTEVDVGRFDGDRFAIDFVVVDVLAGLVFERPHHRPSNEVGERHFATAGSPQVVVDDNAVVNHQLRGDGANAGCCGNSQTLIHIRGNGFGHPAKGGDIVCGGGLFDCLVWNNANQAGGGFSRNRKRNWFA